MNDSLNARLLRNSRGQFVVEAVLLMIVSVSLIMYASKMAQEKKWMASLVSGPWQKVAGMIEGGVWEDPTAVRAKHPNKVDRHRSPYPPN